MNRLYVFYDGECSLCRRCRKWLASQPAHLEFVFHPFQSAEANRLCPELTRFEPNSQLIVLTDEGAVYAGESAWLMCLYALKNYRSWARKLATPALRPLARRICMLVSHNRLTLSKAVFKELADASCLVSPNRNGIDPEEPASRSRRADKSWI